jgi:3-oxoacyl-[acyl-carrier protein] reductase
MTAAMADRLKMSFEDLVETYKKQIPAGRAGQPTDVAHAISFLVSEGASFVSGQVLYVAGGPLC